MCVCVCVCCHPIYSGRQTCGCTSRRHTGGRSHRISPPSFCDACLNFSREKDSAFHFPRRPLSRLFFVYPRINRSPHVRHDFCERSELLIWQVHQFELGCIKLHTPYRYKVHPKLYYDWSTCTVFYRVEFLNIFQHRVESTVEHKIRLHGRRGKGMAEFFSREKLRHAPQKEGG